MWKKTAKIKIPTLVVRGGNSNVLDRYRAKKLAYDKLVDGYFIEIPNAGHSVVGDNTDDFLIGFNKFIKIGRAHV